MYSNNLFISIAYISKNGNHFSTLSITFSSLNIMATNPKHKILTTSSSIIASNPKARCPKNSAMLSNSINFIAP